MSESVDIKVKRRNPIWILSTFAGLESELSKLGKRMSLDPNLTTSDVIHMLVKNKQISYPDSIKLNWLSKFRNQYAHTEKHVSGDEVGKFVNTALDLIEKIKRLNR